MSGTKINMQIEANANSNELTFEEGFDKFIVYCKIKNLREKQFKTTEKTITVLFDILMNILCYRI